ncbi:Chemoreceptor glutamine deamidase CheD [compost metagenome]
MTTGTLAHVGMSEITLSDSPKTSFVVPGLGSCIALVLYEPGLRLAGMAHVLLPDSSQAASVEAPGKFADTAVPRLIADLVARGAKPGALVAKMAGGAQMFKGGPSLSIGERNIEAVTRALSASQVPLLASDVGGTLGRSIRYEVATERFFVRRRLGPEMVLE